MVARIGKVWKALAAFAMMVAASAPAMAQGGFDGAAGGAMLSPQAMALFAAAFAIGIGTIGTALGQGNAIAKAIEAIGRNPEAAGTIRTTLLIGLAFIESLCIYALVIAFIAIGKS